MASSSHSGMKTNTSVKVVQYGHSFHAYFSFEDSVLTTELIKVLWPP